MYLLITYFLKPNKMKGYLYQLLGGGIEELYWSNEPFLDSKIINSYLDWLENDTEDKEFEEWFNFNHVTRIEKVFVNEIYV